MKENISINLIYIKIIVKYYEQLYINKLDSAQHKI